MISAQEAYRIGLVNEVVPAADLIARAEAILKQISANAPIAVKFALEAVNKGLDDESERGLRAGSLILRHLCGNRRQEGGHVGLPRKARAAVPRAVKEDCLTR